MQKLQISAKSYKNCKFPQNFIKIYKITKISVAFGKMQYNTTGLPFFRVHTMLVYAL